MSTRYVLTEYLAEALRHSEFKQLDDGSIAGRIPDCPGLLVFGDSRADAEDDLRATLEEWVLLGLRLGHELPVIGGIDLNKEPVIEPVDSL
jgi:hypothetical protein